jgi:hypothetical protein
MQKFTAVLNSTFECSSFLIYSCFVRKTPKIEELSNLVQFKQIAMLPGRLFFQL